MMSFPKKLILLVIASFGLGAGATLAADFTCRLTLARSGGARDVTKGIIHMRGNVGERIGGQDQGTGFGYRIEVKSGDEFACRGNRRQVSISLDRAGSRKPFVTGSTCFEPNRDFLVASAAADHWIYFQCYSDNQR